MKNQDTYSIVIADDGNRYVWPAYENLYLPVWVGIETINPAVHIHLDAVNQLIEASKRNNQARINEILSKYY